MAKVRFAVVQFAPFPPTVEDNIRRNKEKAARFVEEAAQKGAHVVVFPEYFLTGVLADHTHLATDVEEWLDDIKGQAKRHQIDIVAGTIVERSATNEEHLLNRSYYVDKNGQVLGTYGKRNLWHPEKDYLTASENPSLVFETSYGKVGLLVCWDLAWPESFRALMEQGVEVVIAPTFWVASDAGQMGMKHNAGSETTYLDHLCVTRAFDNGICLVFANVGRPHPTEELHVEMTRAERHVGRKKEGECAPGSTDGSEFIGRSGVFLPFYGAVHRCQEAWETMFTVDVDLSVLKDAEEVYKIREDYVEYAERARHERVARKQHSV